MEPSIVETFTFLERTKGCARAWSLSQPEHEEALDKFITDLDQIALELKKKQRLGKSEIPKCKEREHDGREFV